MHIQTLLFCNLEKKNPLLKRKPFISSDLSFSKKNNFPNKSPLLIVYFDMIVCWSMFAV